MRPLPAPPECLRLFMETRLDERVVSHVQAVARLAVDVAGRLQAAGHRVDLPLVHAGALLHDIGRSRTHGLDHAGVGAQMLRERDFPEALCLCVERHTGGGIDAQEAALLRLPVKDYTPRTLEEKLVCHIDNLFNGSQRQPVAQELDWLKGRGLARAAAKVEALHQELSRLLGADLDTIPG